MSFTKEEMVQRLGEVLKGPEVAEQVEILYKMRDDVVALEVGKRELANKKAIGLNMGHILVGGAVGGPVFFVTFIISVLICAKFNLTGLVEKCFILAVILGVLTCALVADKIYKNEIVGIQKKYEPYTKSNNLENNKKRYDELKNIISQKLGFLAPDYCYPVAIQEIERMLRVGLADSLKEALQLFENNLKQNNQ